jgi:hypothetical protein
MVLQNIIFDEIKGATLHDIYPNIPIMMKNPWRFQYSPSIRHFVHKSILHNF